MKRLLIVALALLLLPPARMKAEGPDDKYIEIYKLIQDGDQLAAVGQADVARERYTAAQAELKKLQSSYPNWNQQLVDYRMRSLETKLGTGAKPAPVAAPTPAQAVLPATKAPEMPVVVAPQPRVLTAPATPVPAPIVRSVAESDEKDGQIQRLREQVQRLQNDRAVLESKLREALAAQPAAVDPRELSRAEERIKALEKDREVLRVSLQIAEGRAGKLNDSGTADLRKSLAEAKQNLAQQSDTITALRQEKEVLQQHLQAAQRGDQETVRTLRAENETLKRQLADKTAAQVAGAASARPNPQAEKELASTKAALQSSRDAMNSLQVRLRTLQDERDRLEKTRRDLETRLAAAPAAGESESTKVKQLQKERDDLQKKLNETTRQLADSKSKSKQNGAKLASGEEVAGLRARLEALEAHKVPYSAEELALFKKPQEPVVLTALQVQTPAPAKELPASAAPLLAEAQRAFSARRFDEAEKKYLEVLQIDDTNVATLQRLAATQLEQSRPQDAETTLKKALEQNARDARSLLLMGIAKFDQDKFDDAFDNLSRSAQIDPQNAETQNYLGITLSQKGQRAAAETALRKAIQLSPSYASAHYNLAVVYATQQPPFTELARWHYQKSLAYGHPQNPEIEKMLERKQATGQK